MGAQRVKGARGLRITVPYDAHFEGAATTTDGTVTTCGVLTPTDAKVVHVEMRFVARKDDGTQGASYVRFATFRRAGASITQIGTTMALTTREDDAAWEATIDASGTQIRGRVNGAAQDTVAWKVYGTVYYSP